MQFHFAPMTEEQALAICTWRYDPPYDFYSADKDPDDLAELLDQRNPYHAATDEQGSLAGFFSFKETAQVPAGHTAGAYDDPGALDIGLGLRPDLTGLGLGPAFLEAGLAYARARFAPTSFRLSVATFNQRAIRVYERAGFVPHTIFINHTNGAEYEFVCMIRKDHSHSETP